MLHYVISVQKDYNNYFIGVEGIGYPPITKNLNYARIFNGPMSARKYWNDIKDSLINEYGKGIQQVRILELGFTTVFSEGF